MKTLSILISAIILAATLTPSALAKYGGGTGTPDDPYLIRTPRQMNAIGADSNDWDKHFKLMADIDLSSYAEDQFNIIGTDFYNPFTGVFDGNGHAILDFTYSAAWKDNIAIFGSVWGGHDARIVIKDVVLIDPNVDAALGNYVGGLVGELSDGAIINCYVEGGTVFGGAFVGGLVGGNPYIAARHVKSRIENCRVSTSVSGGGYVGGLMGLISSYHATVVNSHSHSDVKGFAEVGGLVGGNSRGEIEQCSASGNVWGYTEVGGLVGSSYRGTIRSCRSSCRITGAAQAGGLVGCNDRSEISNCYSLGTVIAGDMVAGLAGLNQGTITECYSAGLVLGGPNVGGLVGSDYLAGSSYPPGTVYRSFWDLNTSGQTSSAGGVGKTTAQMQTESTFTSVCWDFNTPVWIMCDQPDYPKLWWEKCPQVAIQAEIKIVPRTLNLNSKGKTIVCHISLPEDYDVADIDPNTLFLEDEILAQSVEVRDQQQVAVASFSRKELNQILAGMDAQGQVELTLTGELTDGTQFEGSDTIRVIRKSARNQPSSIAR